MKNLRIEAEKLLNAATATGAGSKFALSGAKHSFQAIGNTSSGVGASVIRIEVSSKELPTADSDWLLAGTITLTLGTTATSDGFVIDASWKWVRGNISSISGTGATVTLWKGMPS